MGQDEGTRNTLDEEEFKRATEEIRDLKLLGFYCFLRGRLGNEGGWLSYRGLSEERRISFQTVQKFLGSLRDLGLIRLRRHGCKGTYLWFVTEMECPSGEVDCPAEGNGGRESSMEPWIPDISGVVPSGIGYAALRTERWLFRFERLPRERLLELRRRGALEKACLVGVSSLPGHVTLISRNVPLRRDVTLWIAVLPLGKA